MEMKRKNESRNTNHEPRLRVGSALILAVVLTSLLAIVGMMFVMVARVDRIATSAISENKELNSAVETVIARISQELVLDVPGMPKGRKDYYDYPDANNAWLASLEPYDAEPNLLVDDYHWRQISDVTGFLEKENWGTQDIEITNSPLDDRFKAIIEDHKKIELEDDGDLEEQLADADGDGVADSKWIELEGINSSKGKTIFAAVRVIDNGAMLNVNTVYADPGVPDQRKGDKLTDIYIDGLVKTGTNDITKFLDNRGNFGDAQLYHDEVSRRIENPDTTTGHQYSLYDISDELELRNRYMVFNESVFTRLESKDPPSLCFGNSLRHDNLWTPVDDPCAFKSWKRHVDPDHPDNLGLDPNESDNLYSFRKLLTTYNFDRIINPYGGRMVNVNKDGAGLIYSAIKLALFTADPNFKDVDRVAAQIAVNLKDFRDNDSDVTPLPDVNGVTYYGFEQPCIYISEVVHKFEIPSGGPIGAELRGYAVELYKPYSGDSDPNNWRLVISGPPPTGGPIGAPIGRFTKGECDIDWSSGEQFHVIRNDPHGILPEIDSNAVVQDSGALVFSDDDLIELRRRVDDVNITVDSIEVTGWLVPEDVGTRSFKRDINRHKCIRRLWGSDTGEEDLTLGSYNNYTDPSDEMIQAHPENEDFTNIGEIGMVFRENAYGGIGQSDTEADVRLDLADPDYHNLFQYLTVFDPTRDNIDNDGDGYGNGNQIDADELKIPGRININTAPWYVIAQLPWVSYDEDNPGTADYRLAQAIVAYRDKLETPVDYSDPNTGRFGVIQNKIPTTVDQNDIREEPGFASIGELALVLSGSTDEYNRYSIDRFSKDGGDLDDFPDLTTPDHPLGGAQDDFEERDVIFARISNLVTVRSDVFTAYILVRIGADGPQKRVMAILDRSNVYTDDGRVQIVALHPVADPR